MKKHHDSHEIILMRSCECIQPQPFGTSAPQHFQHEPNCYMRARRKPGT
jgi:hypothetical protein